MTTTTSLTVIAATSIPQPTLVVPKCGLSHNDTSYSDKGQYYDRKADESGSEDDYKEENNEGKHGYNDGDRVEGGAAGNSDSERQT